MKNMRLEQSYNSPSRERELDQDGDIMGSLAQHFGGKGQNNNQNVSYHDSNIINSIFGGGFGKWEDILPVIFIYISQHIPSYTPQFILIYLLPVIFQRE